MPSTEIPPLSESVFETPWHLEVEPGRFRAWFTRPHGLITQFSSATRFTEEHFSFLAHDLYGGLVGLSGSKTCRFVFIHDWSLLEGYEPRVLELLPQWGLSIRDRIDTMFLDPGSDPSLRMAANAVAAPLRSAGVRFEVVNDLHDIVHGLSLSVLASVP